MKRRFVLASSSPRRRELLALMGLNFITMSPNIDERQRPGEAPVDYVQRMSKEKAGNVALEVTQPLVVIAADTIVIDSGEVLGKPVDAAAARTMLRRLRGRVHQVCTSVTLIDFGGGNEQRITEMAMSDVYMRNYTDEEIEDYIATGDPFDKAGGYAVQHAGFHPVEHIDGSYTNVVGLPVEVLRRLLSEIGWEVESLPQTGLLGRP